MKPRRIEYEVGKDIHGRAVSLTFETDHYTKTSYRIHVEAANQRDDSQTIAGLTVEVILAMAEAVKAVPNT